MVCCHSPSNKEHITHDSRELQEAQILLIIVSDKIGFLGIPVLSETAVSAAVSRDAKTVDIVQFKLTESGCFQTN